jgi:cyclopropane-fatty-acyl-phospholipid synthase
MIDELLETGLVPDVLIRVGIRQLLKQTLRERRPGDPQLRQEAVMRHYRGLCEAPIAEQTRAANEQHYEVPTAFYQRVLGKRLKYSSGFWGPGCANLEDAEEAMLRISCERAQLKDGQRILELGCGWGSLSLWMAEHYPEARITAVSNSRTQKEFIDGEARRLGFGNLTVLTADMNDFEHAGGFDRVVSVEMFEHMKNYRRLLAKIARWLEPGGLLFVHIFTHRDTPYHYEDRGPSDWMTRYFFAGGQMPSQELLLYFQEELRIREVWAVSGVHYERTAEAWLANMDANRESIWPLFERTYGSGSARKWWVYWRVFFMACAELWGFRGGTEWGVTHYLFEKP